MHLFENYRHYGVFESKKDNKDYQKWLSKEVDRAQIFLFDQIRKGVSVDTVMHQIATSYGTRVYVNVKESFKRHFEKNPIKINGT